jgi:S-adenosylmethionine uptake transporter
MARALKIADASVIFPMDFLRVPLIAVVGYLIYGETLDIWVIAGGLLIFLANYYLIQRENAEHQKAK